jgi:hypothetical protein
MTSSRLNALDQFLDISGTLSKNALMTLADEPNGLGAAISGQTGSAAEITSFDLVSLTVGGLSGMTIASVGNFLTLSGTNDTNNTGTFLIDGYINDGYVTVLNLLGSAPDLNNGAISWTERGAYSLQDDLNFERTDRAAIKGVAYSAAIPTYVRPSDTTTLVPANLSNIAGVTLDAHAWVINKLFPAVPVALSDAYILLSDAGNLHHADANNKTGVPITDGLDTGVGKLASCYVEIINPSTENYLIAKGGIADGYRIFGLTRAGGSGVSPNSVEVEFRAVKMGAALSTSIPYSFDGYQPTTVDMYYGYREQADSLTETAFRTTLVNGLFADATTSQEVSDILATIGIVVGDTDLSTHLTNITNYFPFSDLGTATPTVVDALNILNQEIGDRNFTSTIINDGYTVTQALQALSTAIEAASHVRIIQRITGSDIPAGTPITIPGGYSYTQDTSNNGQNLSVFTRGVLRDPGPIIDGNDYSETSPNSITCYARLRVGDHINYYIYA